MVHLNSDQFLLFGILVLSFSEQSPPPPYSLGSQKGPFTLTEAFGQSRQTVAAEEESDEGGKELGEGARAGRVGRG